MKKNIMLLCLLATALFRQAAGQNTFPATGNVGIGTTSPQARLSFTDLFSTAADGITWYSGAPASYGIYKTAGSWAAPNYQQLRLNWATGVIIDPGTAYGKSYLDVQGSGIRISSGNLGIGTTNAQARLSFADLFSTAADGITWYSGAPTSYGIYKTAGSWAAPNYQQLKLNWATGVVIDPGTAYGKSYLEVLGNGIRVPSGTIAVGNITMPAGYKLFVEQGILTEKVKVAVKTSGDWADHVFNKNYPLMPLSEVEAFIQLNGHLPGIPPAKEMVRQGNDLGQTDAKLLEKIEELTLYMIELKKENKQLYQLIGELNNKIPR